MAKFLWIALGLLLFLPGLLLVSSVIRFFFARSFILGLVFVLFFLPALIRFVFFLFFTVLAGILALLPAGRHREAGNPGPDARDDAVDVNYKID